MTLLLLALACSEPAPAPGPGGATDTAAPEADSGDAAADTAEDTLPGGDRPASEPAWTADEVGAAITAAVAAGLPDPRDERDIYLWMMSHGDDECPGNDYYLSDTHLYGCITLDDWFYSGISDWLESDETEAGVRTVTWEVNGDFLLKTPEPEQYELEVGGHARAAHAVAEDGSSASLWLEHSGTWKWEGHESWLATGASGRFSQTLLRDAAGRTVTIEGAIGFDRTWLAFDHVVLSDGDCAWSGSGAVEVRDPSGAWHRVDLGETCSACGTVTFDGRETLGEACVDLAPIATALDDAWEEL